MIKRSVLHLKVAGDLDEGGGSHLTRNSGAQKEEIRQREAHILGRWRSNGLRTYWVGDGLTRAGGWEAISLSYTIHMQPLSHAIGRAIGP